MTTRAVLAVWTLALLAAGGAVVLVLGSNHTDDKIPTILLAVPAALAFVASGIIARAQRPENATGILLVLVGFTWSFGALTAANDDYLFTAGLLLQTVFSALLAHLFLAFPTGRLSSRTDRGIVATFYAVALVGPALVFVFDEGEILEAGCDGPCPENMVAFLPAQTVATAIAVVYALVTLAMVLLVLVRLFLRWRSASPALRRSLTPVFATAAALISIVVVQTVIGFVSEDFAEAINWFPLAGVLAVPFSFLYGLLRPRFGTATRRLVAELSEKRHPAEVQAVLRRVLRDPDLQLGLPEGGGYVDVDGRPLELPTEGSGRAVTTVGDEVIVHDTALHEQPELDAVRDAAHIALERGITLRSLESSERRAGALLEAIPDSMYRVAADGTFREFRLSDTARLPIDADDLVGLNVRDVLSPEATAEVLEAMRVAATNDSVEVVNYTLDYADEPRRYLEARIVKSGPDESVAIVRDVTERTLQQQALEALAEGQAALRRVAVAVATAERPEAVFDVVTEEVARLLGADAANLVRFNDLEGVIVGKWSGPGVRIPGPGTRVEYDGGPVDRVRLTGAPARGSADDADVSPRLAALLRELSVTSLVAAPISVSGSLWGAVVVSVTDETEFPPDAEERIGQFANLVAVALANAEAREQLAGLAEGRAALSRVAVAVATATQAEEVFGVVTEEVGRLFRADAANLIRFDRVNERDGLIVGRWSLTDSVISPVGTRIELLGGAVTRVRQTGQPARGVVGDRARTEPELHARLTELGVKSYVAAPIEVSGELWGAVVVWLQSEEEFPLDAEERLVQFGKLVSVALANAQAREDLAGLAEEQAAVSRVAVAVATEEQPELLFDRVSEEAGKLFGASSAATVRYLEGEEATVIVGGWDRDEAFDRKGVRVPFQGGAIARVHDSGLPERVDAATVSPEVRERMAAEGVSSQVAAPIVVSGRLWGATSISIGPSERFPSAAEERLGKFTSLVAVALANAEAREQLSGLAEEQAALSRVAVAVATEQEPEGLFNTVSREIGLLFGAQAAETVRYVEDADEAEVVGGWTRQGGFELELGGRLPFQGGAITRVARTGRAARIDLENEPPDVQQHMRDAGVTSGVAAPIVVSGRLWGATSISSLGSDPFPQDAEMRLEKFTNLVAVALANAEARAELTASRARIVQAGDAERRRLERNLHDGAQQRLVTLALALRLAQARLPEDPDGAREMLERASEELAVGLEELRELARGIHPAILTDRGLVPALQALADRSSVPVRVSTFSAERLPEPVEAAAFYVVAESLTNVAKYASATEARVDVVRDDGRLVVEVTDDGVGGADVSRGTGLRGLADRIEALDGRLLVQSEPGRGTTVRAELPLDDGTALGTRERPLYPGVDG